MAEDILDDIVRLKRHVTEASREQDIGKDIGPQLAFLNEELDRLLEKAEARLELLDRESLDARTRFVSDLAGRFLMTIMQEQRGSIGTSEIEQAVEMAEMIVARVREHF